MATAAFPEAHSVPLNSVLLFGFGGFWVEAQFRYVKVLSWYGRSVLSSFLFRNADAFFVITLIEVCWVPMGTVPSTSLP